MGGFLIQLKSNLNFCWLQKIIIYLSSTGMTLANLNSTSNAQNVCYNFSNLNQQNAEYSVQVAV